MSSHAARRARPSAGTSQTDPILWSLEKDQGWYDDLAKRSRDLVCIHDFEGRLLSVNPAAALSLGYSVEELLRIPLPELIAPEYRAEFDEYLETIAREREAQGLLMLLARSGQRRIWKYHNTLRSEGLPAPVVRGVAYDVTEQKQVEWELRKSEERYRSVIAAMAEGVILVEADGRVVAANPSAERIFGLKSGELAGIITTTKDWEPYTIHEDGSPFLVETYPATVTLRTGQPQTNVCMGLRHPERGLRWLQINAHPLFRRGESTPYAAVVSFTDITERSRAEKRLREYERVVEGLEEMIVVVDRNYRYVLANRSFLKYRGLEKEQLLGRSIDQILNKESLDVIRQKLDECFQGKVVQYEIKYKYPKLGERDLLISYFPIEGPDGVDRAACVLQDITERKQAEENVRQSEARERARAKELETVLEALAKSEEQYRSVVEAMAEGVVLRDAEGRILACNQSFERVTGMTGEQLLSTVPKAWTDRTIHEDGTPFLLETHPSIVALRTGEAQSNVRMGFRKPDGSISWISVNARPMFRSGESRPYAVLTTYADITEQKRADESLRRSEAELKETQRVAHMGSWRVNVLTGEASWSEELYRMAGLDGTQRVSSFQDMRRYLTPESWDWVQRKYSQVLETGPGHGIEVEFYKTDGTTGRLMLRGALDRDAAGKVIGMHGGAMDITARKQVEQVLRESEQALRTSERQQQEIASQLETERARLIEAQAVAKVGSWEIELPSFEITWSEQTHRIFETDPSHFHPKRPDFVELVHPEDRAKVDATFEASLETHEPATVEYRIVMADGRVKVLEEHWKVFLDGQGRPARLMGTCQDITARKQAEQALRESEERLRLAQSVAKMGVFERNFQTLVSRWSPEMEEMYGLPPGGFPKTIEAFLDLVHPEDRVQVKQCVEQSGRTGEGQGEWRVTWPDGTVHWIAGRWRVFRDPEGCPLRAIGIDHDITERKRVEEELRLAKERLSEEKLYLEQEIDTELRFEEIVGQSAALRNVMENVAKVAGSDATVLLLGETGTGKELVARALHRLSSRAGNSFIKVNCAAIPTGLLESELFGHEKGAFTGAVARKIGRLELADKGTLFLDEIGEIPLVLQPKLLRVLQDMEFERLGGTQTLKVDFRLIAATNRDLAGSVREKEFRSDLYYRLNVFPIRVPPLRERREDIQMLAWHFLHKCAKRMGKSIASIPKKTIDALMQWEWPGNVRELENFIERSVILTHGSVLAAPLGELRNSGEIIADGTLEAAEREHILRALRESRGKISGPYGAAQRLGLKRTTLQSKLRQMGIDHRKAVEGD